MVYGDLCTNGQVLSVATSGSVCNGWTLGANWTLGTNLLTHASGSTATVAQTSMTVVAGHIYLATYTVTYTSGTSVTVSVGGTSGTARGASGTFTDVITAGTTAALAFTPTTNFVGSVSAVSCVDMLQSAALTETQTAGAMWTGGPVSPLIKYMMGANVFTGAISSFSPSSWILCDMLLAYPGIDNNVATIQNLTTTITLPRYTSGAGVRAFLINNQVTGANAQNVAISYTNSTPTAGQGLPSIVALSPSQNSYTITHSGQSAGNYGPFLPLSGSDAGIQSVQSIQFSAGGGTAGYSTLILCRPLVTFNYFAASQGSEKDFVNQCSGFPRIYDGSCIGMLFFCPTAPAVGSNADGAINFVWG